MHEQVGSAGPQAFQVAELLDALHGLLREQVGRVWVMGEVSNFTRAASGHCYLTLKDDSAQVRAVLFRGYAQHVPFELENGLEVLVYADVSIYEPRGDLQLILRRVEPRGQGALQLAFEQLRERLSREGLFDLERKRPLLALPRCIGVVASRRSAALRDVLQVSGRRFPQARILICHTRVQGDGAECEIEAALECCASHPDVEVILLVRGGGSLEDLWAFNTEKVARAVAACPVPVVTGVGHEVDLSIADLAADVRAPTPSAAAELAFPNGEELRTHVEREGRRLYSAMIGICEGLSQNLDHRVSALQAHSPSARLRLQAAHFGHLQQRMLRGVEAQLRRYAIRLTALRHALDRQHPSARLAASSARIETLSHSLRQLLAYRLETLHGRLAERSARLNGLSPLSVLGRGYAIVQRAADDMILRNPEQVSGGDRLRIRLAEGELQAVASSDEGD